MGMVAVPTKHPSPCNQPRCSKLTQGGYCDEHETEHQDFSTLQESEENQFYSTTRWRKVRKRYISRHPVCQVKNCDTPTQVVDHIKPIEFGGEKLDRENLQSLCRAHHAKKTGKENALRSNCSSEEELLRVVEESGGWNPWKD